MNKVIRQSFPKLINADDRGDGTTGPHNLPGHLSRVQEGVSYRQIN
jgi:hypothetical protein